MMRRQFRDHPSPSESTDPKPFKLHKGIRSLFQIFFVHDAPKQLPMVVGEANFVYRVVDEAHLGLQYTIRMLR